MRYHKVNLPEFIWLNQSIKIIKATENPIIIKVISHKTRTNWLLLLILQIIKIEETLRILRMWVITWMILMSWQKMWIKGLDRGKVCIFVTRMIRRWMRWIKEKEGKKAWIWGVRFNRKSRRSIFQYWSHHQVLTKTSIIQEDTNKDRFNNQTL